MKNLKKFVISFVLMTAVAAFAFAAGNREGNGLLTTQEHKVPAFERVHVGSNADVRIHQNEGAQETKIVVSADSNLHEFIEVRYDQKHRAVEIRTPRQKDSFPRFTVDIYCPAITGVGLAGTATVVFTNPFVAESFAFDMAGSGSLTLQGSAKNVAINLVGDGTFNGEEFKTENTVASVVGEGKLIVWTDVLAVNVTGNAEINYRGNPEMDISGVGNGRFLRIGD